MKKEATRFVYLSILFLVCYSTFSTSNVLAASDFSSAYDITYDVKNSGLTTVTQNIHLTNLTTNYYASEYTLTFGTEQIDEVNAWDNIGALKINVEKSNETTKVHAIFNEKVVGEGKTLNWNLRYQSPEIARKLGRILEINIPRVSQDEEAKFYNVSIKVPSDFGEPVYIWPKPKKNYYWTLKENSRQGIVMAFGDWQGFSFDLNYFLENSQIVPRETYITLPPDTPYQQIILDKITPSPREIIVDEDGNWLASYLLLPKQKQDIRVSGFAKVSFTPLADYPKEEEGMVYQKYLKAQKFWEVEDPEIVRIAQELKTPKAIYDFVVSKLNYDYQRANTEAKRLGAKQALLNSNKAICMEFTDLFIALSRAAGIPAREVDGYAYTQNAKLKPLASTTDILHAWPEYWDEKGKTWIQVDPTWGNTSLTNYFDRFDFNHLTFVKRGVDSTTPYPAGSYKHESGGKDVYVDFSSEFTFFTPNPPETKLIFPKRIFAGFPLEGKVSIKNENKVALYNLHFDLSSSLLQLKASNLSIPILPPYAQKIFNVGLENKSPLTNGQNILTISNTGYQMALAFQIVSLPFLIFLIIVSILVIFVLLFFIRLIAVKLWKRVLKKE